jgi:peroxiredoxin
MASIPIRKPIFKNKYSPNKHFKNMKNILFIIAAVSGSLFTACDSQTGFTVNGTSEDITEGKALLLVRNNNTLDTLASAPIVDGAFTLTGKVEEVTLANLTIAGSRNGVPLFIENNPFTVKLGKGPTFEAQKLTAPGTPTTVEGGGAVQQVFNHYFKLQQELLLARPAVLAAYYAESDPVRKDSIRGIDRQLQKEMEDKADEVVNTYPDAYATAYYLYTQNQQANLDQLQTQFARLGENAKASKYGKLFADRIRLLESVAIGQEAPDFKLATPEGDTISLHAIAAKVKLIDFWASWCGPCRGENPNVVKAYAKYHPKGLEIIGVSLDNDKDAWIKAIADDNLTWKHGSDLQGWQAAPAKLYGVNAIPHTVLLDENNKIIAKNLRGDALKQKLAELLD